MLNFNEEQIKIVSAASKNAGKKELNLYCAYYPSSGNVDFVFGVKTRHFPGKDYKPNGIAVALDVIEHPIEPDEIRAMIEAACRRALEKHPTRRDLKGKL